LDEKRRYRAHKTRTVRRRQKKLLKPGEEYDVKISTVNPRGEGVAQIRGSSCLVPNATRGENVRIRIMHVRPRFVRAKIVSKLDHVPVVSLPEFPLPLEVDAKAFAPVATILKNAIVALKEHKLPNALHLIHQLRDSIRNSMKRLPEEDLNRLTLDDIDSLCRTFESQAEQDSVKAERTLLSILDMLGALREAEGDVTELKSILNSKLSEKERQSGSRG